MITEFKLFEVHNMSFLENYNEYILLIYPNNMMIIVINLGNQLRKIYSSENGEFKHFDEPFYFTLSSEQFNKYYVYDSDSLEDILNNIDLYKNAKNYNL